MIRTGVMPAITVSACWIVEMKGRFVDRRASSLLSPRFATHLSYSYIFEESMLASRCQCLHVFVCYSSVLLQWMYRPKAALMRLSFTY